MSLLAEVRDAARQTGPRCTVAAARDALSDTDAAELDELLADPNTNKSAVARALMNRGHRVSIGTLGRHVRGECRCTR